MRSNVKTIKLTAWLSLVLAAITYIVSIKGAWGVRDSKWLPDVFLLAVFGGAFASMLVVLICEISKYCQNRDNVETYLFSHLNYLYGHLLVISRNISFLSNHKEYLQKNVLAQLIANAESEMNAVYYTDYAPFSRANKISKIKQDYDKTTFTIIRDFLHDCGMLDIAIITDMLLKYEKKTNGKKELCNNAHLVLTKLSVLNQKALDEIDLLLERIDQSHNNKFNWSNIRKHINEEVQENQTDLMEKFIEEK